MILRDTAPAAAAVLTAALAFGCGESTTRVAGEDDVGDGGLGATPDAGGAGPDAGGVSDDGCTGAGLGVGDFDLTFDVDDRSRSASIHVPPAAADGEPMPLILNFHGFTSNADQQVALSRMNVEADRRGFVTVTPEGVGAFQSWNGGACCGVAVRDDVDDVAFARALVAEAADRVCVDSARIYATGMSNGGFLSHRIACEAADLFAGIAPVAGVIGVSDAACAPSAPIPVIHFHGTADGVVPYDGRPGLSFRTVDETMEGWARRNGCVGDPVETTATGNATCVSWNDCDDDVEVTRCVVEGFGHWWPGTPGDAVDADIDATEVMWDFFDRLANTPAG